MRSALLVSILLCPVLAGAAQTPAPRTPGSGAAPPQSAPAVSFETAEQRAAAARDRADPAEAIRWYREGVRLRPDWDEGWWYLGALSYEKGESAAAVRAFSRFVELKPDSGPAWALRGLSEFQRKDYEAALRHLTKGLSLGTVGNAEIRDAVYYHVALLRIRAGQFVLAVEPLSVLARANPESPSLVTACGLALLRMPYLPDVVPGEKQELVQMAGRAACAALALQDAAGPRFEEVLRRYPNTPNLHYGYGAYLLRRADGGPAPQALAQFEKEIELDPTAVYARLEIAYEKIRDGQHAQALPYAEEAVRLAPGLFAAHNALGRALCETGQVEKGIAELEEAVRLAPESLHARATLAGAYAQSGRPADAERQRDAIRKLSADRGTAARSSLTREGLPGQEAQP